MYLLSRSFFLSSQINWKLVHQDDVGIDLSSEPNYFLNRSFILGDLLSVFAKQSDGMTSIS